jgi:CheY-like chemotaxis protein
MENKKKILLIDDDKDFVDAQTTLLSYLGHEIVAAYSAKEGFEKVVEHNPDLIILDVNMESEFSGFELHKKIREDKRFVDIPIIIMTGIETYHVSHQIIEMYRSMKNDKDFEVHKVLHISNHGNDVAIEYYDEEGKTVYLPLDSFISKSNVQGNLANEIAKFI